jgi:lon-related putative ATP-dependent protease
MLLVARNFAGIVLLMTTLAMSSSRSLFVRAIIQQPMLAFSKLTVPQHRRAATTYPKRHSLSRVLVRALSTREAPTSEKTPPSLLKASLTPEQLRWHCDPEQFDFQTSAELQELDGLRGLLGHLGQDRAWNAIQFGVDMKMEGYNLYVLGPSGIGKRTIVRDYLHKRAQDEPKPADWCYVQNFVDTDKPKVIQLPSGEGRQLQEDIELLTKELQSAVPKALESQDLRRRIEDAGKHIFDEHNESLLSTLEQAKENNVMVMRAPNGEFILAGADEEQSLTPEQVETARNVTEELQPKLRGLYQNLPELKKSAEEKIKALNREAATSVIQTLISPLKIKYDDSKDVLEHLEAVETDLKKNFQRIRPPEDDSSPLALLQNRRLPLEMYHVNVFVDNTDSEGAPLVFEEHPTYHNLIGRIDYASSLGSLTTNFLLLKSGALHRANGGYLVLQARDILTQPFSWEALKRAVRSRQAKIESLGAELSLISTVSLQPEPIPLDVKVVLLGDRLLYYLLHEYDPDFAELFKVECDFNDEMDRSEEACQLYARMLASLARKTKMRSLDRHAVAAMIEQAARQAGDQEKLSTHMRESSDLLRESDYWAGKDGADAIGNAHVRKAIDQQIYRADRVRELVHEQIRKGTIMVDVEGESVGQVNGLSVLALGNLSFGRPSRITATTRLGKGKVVDIEREVELGGSIHSKGVLILSSLLASRYAKDCPLTVSASLVFEQSYGLVEGDSASMAELCALLSSLSGLPIRQGLAITGSVNQHGLSQPIGGATQKIEGFYDICSAIGLTGEQGVLIPSSNAKHLMLRPDVVEAVANDRFSVYTYENVDEAITLLTGVSAGDMDDKGLYPPGTVNFLVDQALHEMADLIKSFDESETDTKKK